MKHIFYTIFILSTIACGTDFHSGKIKSQYAKFYTALAEGNGEVCSQLLTSESHIYFEDLLREVKQLNKIELEKKQFYEKLIIAYTRAVLPNSQIQVMSPRDFEVFVISRGFLTRSMLHTRRSPEIKSVRIKDDIAVCDMVQGPDVKMKRENKVWLVGIQSQIEHIKNLFEQDFRMNKLKTFGEDFEKVVKYYAGSKMLISTKDIYNLPSEVINSQESTFNDLTLKVDCQTQNNVLNEINSKLILFYFEEDIEEDAPSVKLYKELKSNQEFQILKNTDIAFHRLSPNCPGGNYYIEKLNIKIFPTLLFLNQDEEILFKKIGFIRAESVIELLKSYL